MAARRLEACALIPRDVDLSPLRLDQEQTWSRSLVARLEENLAELEAYEQRRRLIDKQMERDVFARIQPPENRHRKVRDNLLNAIRAEISERKLVGYHCTRLTPREVDDIRAGGLVPLSRGLIDQRIAVAVSEGLVSRQIGDRLLEGSLCDDPNRCGMIWLIFSEAVLHDEAGVRPLLANWGGEATYRKHEKNTEISQRLAAIGEACIVEVQVAVTSIQSFADVSEHMLRGFAARRGIEGAHSPELEGYVREPIAARDIIALHRQADCGFKNLTGIERWDAKL